MTAMHDPRPALTEVTERHTHLMRCALEVDDARAYWERAATEDLSGSNRELARRAFDGYWFGDRSLDRITVLVSNFRARFDAYPPALEVLAAWSGMPPETRRLICHWHTQLSDPLYRDFSGRWLVQRRDAGRTEVSRDLVVRYVASTGGPQWGAASHVQFASKLLSTAYAAGLVGSRRDPRPLVVPRVSHDALLYLLHLLRAVAIDGNLLDNPYLASVGLSGALLHDRLRATPTLHFAHQAGTVDVELPYPSLRAWAQGAIGVAGAHP